MRERAAQRDEAQRAEYWYAIFEECTDPAQLVFADETAKVDSVLRRKRGWGGRGQRVESVRLLHNSTHVSILACYGIGGFIDYHHVEGGYNAADFMDAVESMIVPHLNVWPAPGSILVLDNCRIHHTYEAELRAMVEARGAKLLFLAPYCPIDNPIESAFNCFKMFWVRHEEFLATLPRDEAIRTAVFGCYSHPAESARKSFAKCGYGF
jgi:DDE superfamily endonuclease